MRWTKREEEILKQLCENNILIDDILSVFPERTRNQIRHKASLLGLQITYFIEPKINIEKFKELIKNGSKRL